MHILHSGLTAPLSRRTVLRGLGVSLALPWLEAMGSTSQPKVARRMVCIQQNLGFLAKNFFPTKSGKNFDPPLYLEMLKKRAEDFTVFSGVSLPGVDGGHASEHCFLTGAPHPAKIGFRNSVSLDQFAADRLGNATRIPSLTLTQQKNQGMSLSFTGAGFMIPGYYSPEEVFKRLFIRGTPAEVSAQIEELRRERSILDVVGDRSKQIGSKLGYGDRAKMDQFSTAVRELEKRLVEAEAWKNKEVPKVSASAPQDPPPNMLIAQSRLMFDLMHLSLTTDSTRFITLYLTLSQIGKPDVDGVGGGNHGLSHHGQDPEKLAQLKLIDIAHIKELGRFLDLLAEEKEDSDTVLDRTMVLYGSNLGDANNHGTKNLPVLLAGGGFRHGQHLAFDETNNYPLSNLYVSMLQRLGLPVDAFSSGKTTMAGLDMIS